MTATKGIFIKGRIQQPSDPVYETLNESEVHYRRLFENAREGIIVVNDNSCLIIDVNTFLTKMIGDGSEEFIGKAIWNFCFFRDIRT